MSDFRRVVFTIHGINSEGEWQKEVEQELDPHFRCIPLEYRQFRYLGWPKILFPLLRRYAIQTVARQHSREIAPVEPAHLIAHSFGTWISLQVMRRPGTYFNRVVFTASPLPADLDWEDELKDNPQAFQDLTNERGCKDQVLAWGDIASGKDSAGRVGFRGHPDRIHDSHAFRLSCPLCRNLSERSQARIHNIAWSEFHHSGWFEGSGHGGSLWLPYFWGFRPEEYAEFIRTCLELADLEGHGDIINLKSREATFGGSSWAWTRRGDVTLTMAEYIEESIGLYRMDKGQPLDQVTIRNHSARATRLVWRIVKDAIEERRRPLEKRQQHILRWLHPQLAIRAAIEALEGPWTIGG